MRRTFLICATIGTLLVGHLAFDTFRVYRESLAQKTSAYDLVDKRLAKRVVLIIVDSWALRIMETPRWMPKLFARMPQGASGVLWAPEQTDTMHGIVALSTGSQPSGLAAIGLVSSSKYKGWTIFDDIVSRGEVVSFHGGPGWVPLFGDRGTGNFRVTGHGPLYRRDDIEGLQHIEQALLSSTSPALSVVHISETDFAAHQYGTERDAYAEVLQYWDTQIDRFLAQILTQGTTVIMTADHGNDLNGNHGGSGPIYRRVPVLMWGAGIRPGAPIEMNATDMPATIAVLLGIRAPAGVVALPAVEALALPPVEQARILRNAFEESVLNNPRILDHNVMISRARAAIAPSSPDESPAAQILRLRATASALAPDLALRRAANTADWIFVCLTFAAALVMGSLASRRGERGSSISLPQLAGWIAAFLVIEAALPIRFVFAPAIKAALRNRSLGLMAALASAAVLAVVALIFAWSRRRMLTRSVKTHSAVFVTLLYLLTTVLAPLSSVGIVCMTMLAALTYSGRWPVRLRTMISAAFGTYFVVGTLILWLAIGESTIARYAVGLPIGAILIGALAFAETAYASTDLIPRRAALSGILLLLLLFPAETRPLSGLSQPEVTLVASLLLLLLCYGLEAFARPPRWVWIGPALLLGLWWSSYGYPIYLALGACAALVVGLLCKSHKSDAQWAGVFTLLACMLLMMTEPPRAVPLLLLLWVIISFMLWKPHPSSIRDASIFVALVLVASRYALFELFGSSGSPVSLYGLQQLDLASAYVGDPARAIVPAALMVLLKVGLASAVLVAALTAFRPWRDVYSRAAALAGMFLLLNLAQAAVRTSLSYGPRTYLYDPAFFSLAIHTGIFVVAMLALGALTIFIERPEVSREMDPPRVISPA